MFGMFPVGFLSGTPTIPAAVISGFPQFVQADAGMVFRWSNAATNLDFLRPKQAVEMAAFKVNYKI
jgi:hypothetical protein